MSIYHTKRWKGLGSLSRLLVGAALALPLAACDTDKIVEVEDPAQRTPQEISNSGSVPALVQGAFRQFVGGYSGFGDDAFLSGSAVITDEMYYGDTFTTRDAADKRTLQPPILGNITDPAFARLQQSRFNARRAFAVVSQYTTPATATSDAATKAQLRTIEGYVYTTLSEGWCSAVPFSVVPDTGAIDPAAIQFGASLSVTQMNDTAVSRFNEAIALNPANNLAAVGKARSLLNNAKYALAASAVAAVPTLYVFRLEHSANTGAENNPMFSLTSNGRYGVANLEGGFSGSTASRPDTRTPGVTLADAEGIAFRGLGDPRVPWSGRPSSGNGCFSSSVICWLNNNYPTLDSDVPLASGVEARLIEAEGAMQAGNGATMITKLNELRAQAATLLGVLYPDQKQTFPLPGTGGTITLAPLSDPGAGLAAAEALAARRSLLFQERALWLYNTGHRQGDLRRLIRHYGLPSSSVFPTGNHFRGGTYGSDVAYPVPFGESNNPEYKASACVTTQA